MLIILFHVEVKLESWDNIFGVNKIEKLLLERHENEDKINFEESNWNLKKVINFNVKKKSTRIFVHI